MYFICRLYEKVCTEGYGRKSDTRVEGVRMEEEKQCVRGYTLHAPRTYIQYGEREREREREKGQRERRNASEMERERGRVGKREDRIPSPSLTSPHGLVANDHSARSSPAQLRRARAFTPSELNPT